MLVGIENTSVIGALDQIKMLTDIIAQLELNLANLKLATRTKRINQREVICTKCGCKSHTANDCDGRVICRIYRKRGHIRRIYTTRLDSRSTSVIVAGGPSRER